MHEGSLDEVDAVGLSDLGEKRGNLVVLSAGGDELLAELAHVVGSAHEVVLPIEAGARDIRGRRESQRRE